MGEDEEGEGWLVPKLRLKSPVKLPERFLRPSAAQGESQLGGRVLCNFYPIGVDIKRGERDLTFNRPFLKFHFVREL